MSSRRNILKSFFLILAGILYLTSISSCGKSAASAAGLDIQYEVFNLSPDLYPVNLYIDYKLANTSPFTFEINQGYFYVPSKDVPYQFRSAIGSQLPLFNRSDTLTTGAKYSLFITGSAVNNTLVPIFTVDTAVSPAAGRGAIRFVNASPSATGGLDIYANGTPAFSKVIYPGFTGYIQVPVGNYNFQINVTGSASVLNTVSNVTIQDGRLYTLFAYGYTTRIDSAAFNAGVITNK